MRSKQKPSLRHRNLSRPQLLFGQFTSSSPEEQSGNPSQTYDLEMHRPESHMNWFLWHISVSMGSSSGGGLVEFVVHPNSSLRSLQSCKRRYNVEKWLVRFIFCWLMIVTYGNSVTFPPIRNAFVVAALEHPVMARWHYVIGLVTWIWFRRWWHCAVLLIVSI